MNYYNEIKEQLINNEIYKKVKDFSKNRSDLSIYYNVGKLLVEAGKHYWEGILKQYCNKLTIELGKGYTITNLKHMRQFYLFCEKSHTVRDKLTGTHYRELIFMNDISNIEYYIRISIEQNLSYRKLLEKIKNMKGYRILPRINF